VITPAMRYDEGQPMKVVASNPRRDWDKKGSAKPCCLQSFGITGSFKTANENRNRNASFRKHVG